MLETQTMGRFKTHFKQRLLEKSAREGERISLRDAAKATGLSLGTLARWNRDEVIRLEPEVIDTLLKYLGCSFEELVEYVPDEAHEEVS